MRVQGRSPKGRPLTRTCPSQDQPQGLGHHCTPTARPSSAPSLRLRTLCLSLPLRLHWPATRSPALAHHQPAHVPEKPVFHAFSMRATCFNALPIIQACYFSLDSFFLAQLVMLARRSIGVATHTRMRPAMAGERSTQLPQSVTHKALKPSWSTSAKTKRAANTGRLICAACAATTWNEPNGFQPMHHGKPSSHGHGIKNARQNK